MPRPHDQEPSGERESAAAEARAGTSGDLALPCPRLSLAEAGRLITSIERTTAPLARVRPGAAFDADWPRVGEEIEFVDTAVRVYQWSGLHALRITVPEDYAARLMPIRAERLRREAGTPEAGPAVDVEPGLRHRALPEDLIAHLEALPNPDVIGDLYLLDTASPYDPWHAKAEGDPSFVASAASDRHRIYFFKKHRDGYIGDELRHEWAHLVRHQSRWETRAFDQAAEHEGKSYIPRERALVDAAERYAVLLGEEMLSPAPERFLELTRRAPLQSAMLAEILKSVARHCALEGVQARIEYIEQSVKPQVLDRLVADIRQSAQETERDIPIRLLVGLREGGRLNELSNVRALDLHDEAIGALDLSFLTGNTWVARLDLSRTFARPDALSPLASMPLRTLSLARAQTKDSDLHYLEAFADLQALDLSETSVTDRCAPALLRLKSLRRLDLRSTDFSEDGFARLREKAPALDVTWAPRPESPWYQP